jgi:2-C-methyl-D-erythritol 2,4-cyclodiphosphate synthase
MNFRIGFGYDVHRLVQNRELWLGGVKIDHVKGAFGHSDADVLIHAICDAFLGAACLGDIGTHFPDTSSEYKGIDSKILLQKVIALLEVKCYRPVNIDSTLALQKPVIASYIPAMRKILSDIIGLGTDDISIKATTTEKLGFEGREEGVSAYAVVLISKFEQS